MIATRRAELVEAGRILGLSPAALFELDLPDAAAPKEGPHFDKAINMARDIVASLGARRLFVTWGHDPHCDHEAAARLAQELGRQDPTLKLWSYPVWGWHLPPTHVLPVPPPAGMRLAIEDVLDQKRAAIGAHQSQMTDMIDDDPDGFRFTTDTLAHFLRPFEYYIENTIR